MREQENTCLDTNVAVIQDLFVRPVSLITIGHICFWEVACLRLFILHKTLE